MKLSQRWLVIGAIAMIAIILLTIMAAPSQNQLSSGSTYSRSPDGYGGWYAFMSRQGTPVQRWQKPGIDLPDLERPLTLLRVYPQIEEQWLDSQEQEWIEKGNNLVILGAWKPATKAKFFSIKHASDFRVKIDTTRRKTDLSKDENSLLEDNFGAVVWQQNIGKGRLIVATTPHLGANAYQDEFDNYKFLASLVTQRGNSVWVDEYIHGYKDQIVKAKEGKGSWISYLAQTPVASAFVQILIMLAILIWAKNRRFGQIESLTAPQVNNTQAYMQAIAGVLQKANCREFVLDLIGKEEQLQLQKSLGLGNTLVDHQTLIDAWVRQIKRPALELDAVLKIQSYQHRITEKELLNWLQQWQVIRELSYERK